MHASEKGRKRPAARRGPGLFPPIACAEGSETRIFFYMMLVSVLYEPDLLWERSDWQMLRKVVGMDVER